MIVRKDADGNPTSFQARYVNPLDPSKKVGRNFGLEYETEAYRWLDEEHYLVTLHNKGIRQWVHPSQRGTDTMPTFREYAKDYFDKYRKPDTMLFHSPMLDEWLLPPTTIERTFRMAREKIGRPDITFHSLRATHATMLVLEGGTMRETMDDLGHTSLTVAVDSYQRIVREHHRDTVELLAYQYMPTDDPTVIRTVIDQKERQIDKLRREVDGLRKILQEKS